jgi:hypothetical protein
MTILLSRFRNSYPLVINGEEPEKRPPAPFYHTHTHTGKPTREMIGTRAIIIKLALAENPMTKYAIEKATGMAPASVSKYCKQLRKMDILKVEEAKKPGQSYRPYSLGYGGKLAVLAIDLTTEHGLGLDRTALTKELVEKMPSATPFHKFAQRTYQGLIERGRGDIVQDWLKRIAESTYRDGATDAFVGAWMAASGFTLTDKVALSVIDDVFSKMSRKELTATKHFLKYSLQSTVIEELVKQDKGLDFFKDVEEEEDVDNFYMPFKCGRCGYYEPRRRVSIREILRCQMTDRSPVCTNCRMWSKMNFNEEEGKPKDRVRARIQSTLQTKPSPPSTAT